VTPPKIVALMSLIDTQLTALDGQPLDPAELRDRAVLVVNVASRCGFTPQYQALEQLQQRYGDAGFTVLGVPCNQFAAQEPGTGEEIREFCSTTYGTTFPLTEKLDVNGQQRHPLFDWLANAADPDGVAGEVEWNFEKFLIAPSGEAVGRFRSSVAPDSEELIAAIEAVLADERWTAIAAADVRAGDRVRARGIELQVTRIDQSFMGRPEYIAFVEDSAERWLKLPTPADAEVEVLRSVG
jgi:glutathione peroxidase